MGILSNIIGEEEPAFVEAAGQYHLQVIGDPHCQKRLKSLRRSCLKNSSKQGLVAYLHYENNNPYDNNAVRVVINGGTIGYLSRKDAGLYRKMIEKTGREGIVIFCNARIIGKRAWLIKKEFKVWLDLPIEDL